MKRCFSLLLCPLFIILMALFSCSRSPIAPSTNIIQLPDTLFMYCGEKIGMDSILTAYSQIHVPDPFNISIDTIAGSIKAIYPGKITLWGARKDNNQIDSCILVIKSLFATVVIDNDSSSSAIYRSCVGDTIIIKTKLVPDPKISIKLFQSTSFSDTSFLMRISDTAYIVPDFGHTTFKFIVIDSLHDTLAAISKSIVAEWKMVGDSTLSIYSNRGRNVIYALKNNSYSIGVSHDSGNTWNPLSISYQPTNVPTITCFNVNENDPKQAIVTIYDRNSMIFPSNMLYAGITLDAGKTWQKLNTPGGEGYLSMAFYPFEENVLYAATETGSGWQLYKSSDLGNSWQPRGLPISTSGSPQQLIVSPTYPNILYMWGSWMFLSVDTGKTWSNIINDSGPIDRNYQMGYKALDYFGNLYVDQYLTVQNWPLLRSSNYGFHWETLLSKQDQTVCIAVAPYDQNFLLYSPDAYAFLGTIKYSKDRGGSWNDIPFDFHFVRTCFGCGDPAPENFLIITSNPLMFLTTYSNTAWLFKQEESFSIQ
jgi:hypothetical protein